MSSKRPDTELDETKVWRGLLADDLGMVRALVDQVFGVVTGGDGVGKEHWREVLHRVGDAGDVGDSMASSSHRCLSHHWPLPSAIAALAVAHE